MRAITRILLLVSAGSLAAAPLPAAQGTAAPDSVTMREREIRRARSGAGLRLGDWGAGSATSASVSSLPAAELYWQRGMDRHLVVETGVGFWNRTVESGGDRISSYVIPMTSTLKLYPFSGPGSALEPFAAAGAGFTIGVDDRETSAGGLLSSPSSGTVLVLGFALKGQGGVEYNFSRAFGLTVAAGYQWVRFFEQVAGERTYQGLQLMGGLNYRFQY
jgi:hypothetical protein